MNSSGNSASNMTSPFCEPKEQGVLRVLQISDCHLYAAANRRLAGVVTEDSFEDILTLARSSFRDIDLILATGDLVHDASQEGYTRMCKHLSVMGAPVYCLPGNHDIPMVMAEAIRGVVEQTRVTTPQVKRHHNWVVIMLDSTIPGREGGHLDELQLQILEDGLTQHPDCHALICLHHHPVPIGSAWMDKMALNNPDPFFRILDRHPRVRGIIWGHIHQAFDAERHGVKLLGCPSTCIQFTPKQDQFNLDQLPPGLRWLELWPDGKIETGIQRLNITPGELDLSVAGY